LVILFVVGGGSIGLLYSLEQALLAELCLGRRGQRAEQRRAG
jgi:hypothetical protein